MSVLYLLYENGMTSLQETSQVISVAAGEAMPKVLASGTMGEVCNYIRLAAGLYPTSPSITLACDSGSVRLTKKEKRRK